MKKQRLVISNQKLEKAQKSRGDILVTVLVFAAITITVTVGLVTWGATMLKEIRNVKAKEQAFQIAEAGIDYYRWHLAQYPSDYKDGTTNAGPYVHQFYDKDGNNIGAYSLTITPPGVGSTLVKIVSVGTASSTASTTAVSRTIQATMAIPSLAKFAVVANDNMRFGAGTEVFGPIHSNKGIHFDGIAHNLISSALTTYTDPDSGSCTSTNSWGVHTCVAGTGYPNGDPTSPTVAPSRPDVFIAGRQYPVPSIDFTGLTAGLAQLQTLAQNGGKEWTASNAQGYHIVLKTNNTYDLYKVTAQQVSPGSCSSDSNSSSYTQWGTWSIKSPISSNQTAVNTNGSNNYAIPSNGVIFFDDNVWVDGAVNGTRATIVAGIIGSTNPNNYSNITVNSDLKYSNYDGTDVIGLIAQGNVNVGLTSDDDLQIDAALVAENGRVGRFYYASSCGSSYKRTTLTLNGMIATNVRYGFAFTDGTGYATRNINYDANLLYGPPPSFPLATTQYQMISWKEI